MDRITYNVGPFKVGDYAVFETNRHTCVFYRISSHNVSLFHNFRLLDKENDTQHFNKYGRVRELLCSLDCQIETVEKWLNQHYSHPYGIWSLKANNGINNKKQKSITKGTMSLINETYEKRELYSGIDDYHSRSYVDLNKPLNFRGRYRVGVEMEVEFNDEDCKDDFLCNESNWFYCETDGSLDYNTGCEIISVPLRPADAKNEKFWEPLTSVLDGNCNAWDASNCGLHVHFSREILGANENKVQETLGKLLYLYHHHIKSTGLNTGVFGRQRCYNEHDGCTQIGRAAAFLGPDVLKGKKISERVCEDMKKKSKETRYFDINIMNYSTIEFRKGRGTINPSRIAMIVEYCELMCLYAKSTIWSSLCMEGFVSYLEEKSQSEMLKSYIKLYY